ncbi:ECF transporter S component family protein [Legionella septentrionalis]|uniref:Uncharacterized protein n=1 Tax=Legionella septentrionalis TaxID=2498109 RepID=A0A433JKC5_9GAMM|nr:hypothetical protein [Legionella septentrionalis]RUQ88683.1 hypothetical protein EKM59_05075 [Legionella septentrionalis]
MKSKKIPYYLFLLLLTCGASLILGFLSFGGMFALWPVLPLAAGAFVLSVAYESEIYFQNIKGSLLKLLKHNYLKNELGKEFLLTHFPKDTEHCPQFCKDYQKQLELLHKFAHKRLDAEDEDRKQEIEKTLRDMEKWFAVQLFRPVDDTQELSPYEEELNAWLKEHDAQAFVKKYHTQKLAFNAAKIFSTLAGIFMGIGSTYLLVEAFTIIPFLAAIPFGVLPTLIIPMAVVAGAAYGMLTYNAITDMIANDTIRKWFRKIRDDWNNGLTLHSVFIGLSAVFLSVLALALTICTAGTWWSIARASRPLFSWMATSIPQFIVGVVNPVIIGFASIIFNLQNTSETLSMVEKAIRPAEKDKPQEGFFSRWITTVKERFTRLYAQENILQILNPFRLFLTIVTAPLRIVMFIGHLISMGVGDDRVPGIPEWATATMSTCSETLEDFHYFFDFAADEDSHHHADDSHSQARHKHQHEDQEKKHAAHLKELLQERLGKGHDHNHNNDIPTRILKRLFIPIYFAAACWDYLTSKLNSGQRPVLEFRRAFEKQWGLDEIKKVSVKETKEPSLQWKKERAIYKIERFKEKHLQNVWVSQELAQGKAQQLTRLQHDLRELVLDADDVLTTRIEQEANHAAYGKHRFFTNATAETATTGFLHNLAKQAKPMRAC